mgnify:FL=1
MAKITDDIKERSKLTKEEWREYTKTVWSIANVSHREHPAIFPVEIPHRLTKLFSFWGETVLDPFGGTGSTAVAALRLGRNAICVEQNEPYTRVARQRVSEEVPEPLQNALSIVNTDCRDLSFLPDDSVDLIVTSPPYWNKADYGKSQQDLGAVDSYADFLNEMRKVIAECMRVLKPGRKMCVVTANVNQHTDHGLLTFPLSVDLATSMRDAGMVMINEIIWSKDGTGGRWGSANGQRPIFGSYPYPPNLLFKNVHEYIIIFAKPAITKTKGAKVRAYSELMMSAQCPTLQAAE